MKLESYILNDFFDLLNDIEANYCVMNNYIDMPEEIPSDVDIAVDLYTYRKIDSLILRLANKHNVGITQKIWHGYNKCAFILSPLDIDKYFWLQLDFFVDFSGQGFPNLLPSRVMLEGKMKYKNFYIPSPEVEAPFILQRRIFKGDFEVRHLDILDRLYKENEDKVISAVKQVFGEAEGAKLISVIEKKDLNVFSDNYVNFRRQLETISLEQTSLIYRAKYYFWHCIRTVYRSRYPSGLTVAFIGYKSAGKTDMIDRFDEMISGSFHGLVKIQPKDVKDYFKNSITKACIAKITKRKVLWDLDSYIAPWDAIFSSRILKLSPLLPDVIFTEDDSNVTDGIYKFGKEKSIDQKDLKKLVSLALAVQSERTQRHMMNKLSPTAWAEG